MLLRVIGSTFAGFSTCGGSRRRSAYRAQILARPVSNYAHAPRPPEACVLTRQASRMRPSLAPPLVRWQPWYSRPPLGAKTERTTSPSRTASVL